MTQRESSVILLKIAAALLNYDDTKRQDASKNHVQATESACV